MVTVSVLKLGSVSGYGLYSNLKYTSASSIPTVDPVKDISPSSEKLKG